MYEIQIGALLDGRYEIVEKIGTGGMADVYRAKCRLLNRLVALKVLKAEFENDEEFLRRFEIEAQAAASITHPNIVSVYDVGFDGVHHYIVMELVEGITLKEYISQKGALDWREATGYGAQICAALECAHKQGIIHRDIKPHNIIITSSGVAKVTDFGIARASTDSTMVADKSVIGSAHYFSPEQARGGYTDEKTDIYSAGVTLYEMLTGRVPFNSDSAVSVAMMQITQSPTLPREINTEIPESVENIVLKAMNKEQNGRYQSAADMLYDLNAALEGRAIILAGGEDADGKNIRRRAVTGKEDKKEKVPLTKSEKRMVWAAVAAAIVLLGLCGFMLLSIFGGFGFGQMDETKVPNIEGYTLEEAQKALDKEKLKLEIEEEIASSLYEKDTIISQDPAAGRSVKKGSKVRVKVSKGSDGVLTVPNVLGYTKESAQDILAKSNLKAVFTEEENSEIEKGKVIRQSPSAGTEIKEGETVSVYISNGKNAEKVGVPNVIGKSLAQAKNAIEAAGFSVGNVVEEESDSAVGTVILQSPKAGEKAEKGSAIALSVSKEKPPEASATPTAEPTPDMKIKTISLPVPQNKESTQIKVVANGRTIHDALHYKSEVSYDIPVSGKSSAVLEIYHDGKLVGTQTITF